MERGDHAGVTWALDVIMIIDAGVAPLNREYRRRSLMNGWAVGGRGTASFPVGSSVVTVNAKSAPTLFPDLVS